MLPQLRPALLGGCCWWALHLLAEFGALQMLRFPTFTTAIYDQYSSTFNGPAATMLASVLVLCCLLSCCSPSCGCAATGGTPGSRAARRGPPSPARLGRGSRPAHPAALAGVVALALGAAA